MVKRSKACEMLGISVSTIKRLEQKGKLTPKKYDGENSNVFYSLKQVESLMKVE